MSKHFALGLTGLRLDVAHARYVSVTGRPIPAGDCERFDRDWDEAESALDEHRVAFRDLLKSMTGMEPDDIARRLEI